MIVLFFLDASLQVQVEILEYLKYFLTVESLAERIPGQVRNKRIL